MSLGLRVVMGCSLLGQGGEQQNGARGRVPFFGRVVLLRGSLKPGCRIVEALSPSPEAPISSQSDSPHRLPQRVEA